MPPPTPYSDVNAVLLDFAARTRVILGGQFIGLYLYGSLALGDFDPDASDIDFIVVTQGVISADHLIALREMHAHFDRSASPWAGKIEAAYIPREALNHPAPTNATYPQIERGTELLPAPLETGWAFQRYTLREHGITVAGPDPRSLVDPVDPGDMRRAAELIARGWLEQSRQDPSWIAWVRERGSLSFVVLTLCRLLYSLGTGTVVSKPAAARWMYESSNGRWNGLIRRSLAAQRDRHEAPQADLEEMLALLNYTLAQINGPQ